MASIKKLSPPGHIWLHLVNVQELTLTDSESLDKLADSLRLIIHSTIVLYKQAS